MSNESRVERMVPDPDDFCFATPTLNAQLGKHVWHHGACRADARELCLFERGDINAAPLGEDALPRGKFRRAERRDMSRWEGKHPISYRVTRYRSSIAN